MQLSFTKFTPPPRNNSEPKKPKVKNKGFIRASYASSFAAMPVGILGLPVLKRMKKVSQLNPDETVMLRKGVQEGLKQSGLYEKGVRAYRLHEVPFPKLKNIFKGFSFERLSEKMTNLETSDIENTANTIFETFTGIKYGKKDEKALNAIKEEIKITIAKKTAKRAKQFNIPEETSNIANSFKEPINGILAKSQALMFKTGSNACYLPNANKIITPDKSLQTSVFHEMGHALNNNGGAILKWLQKCRSIATMAPGIILTLALLNKRKTTDEKSDNKIQNFFDGIKKNAGKLTALAMFPMVAEEGIASLRGGKIAKNLFKEGKLSKTILNKVRLTNLCGFSTYALATVGMAFAAKTAVKVKDNIQAKYEQKLEDKYQKKLEKKARKNNAA